MKLFHGSDHIIEAPRYGAGKPYNDFGLGFYCTESLEMAQEWSATQEKAIGYANEYEFDDSGLSVLDLTSGSYTVLHWLSVLLENRSFSANHPLDSQAKQYLISTFAANYQDADVIVGNRADDSYFSFARAFLAGSLSYQQLRKAMDLGGLGKQVVLKSPRSFQRLTFIGATESACGLWLPRRRNRDAKARADYQHLAQQGFDAGGLYVQDILREEMTPHDARLQ